MQLKYDFIIAGGGLAGLTAAVEMQQHERFQGKSILIIDRAAKNTNDRTWCYWETTDLSKDRKPASDFSWPQFSFHSEQTGPIASLVAGTYRYHMLRSSTFYAWARAQLAEHEHVSFLQAGIQWIEAETGVVHTNHGVFEAKWVLNSALMPLPLVPENAAHLDWAGTFSFEQRLKKPAVLKNAGSDIKPTRTALAQHFLGYYIRTKTDAFDTSRVMLMDYRVPHQCDTHFVYVLPMTNREALVEYTVFSKELLPPKLPTKML